MRLLYFSLHGGEAIEMALLCQGAGIDLDVAGSRNQLVEAKTSSIEQTRLLSFGVGQPSDEAILDTVRAGGYHAVMVSTPEQVQQFRERIRPFCGDIALIVRHTVNCFDDFHLQSIRNFYSLSPRALSLMPECQTFLGRRLLAWDWLPTVSHGPSERHGFASYVHDYAEFWPDEYAKFVQLNQVLAPEQIVNYGNASEAGVVNDVQSMHGSRATVHIKGGAVCCFAVVHSMAMATPVVMDEETYNQCFFDNLRGIRVMKNVQGVADELRRLASDDDYWLDASRGTYCLAREQFSYGDELGASFREFLADARPAPRTARLFRCNAKPGEQVVRSPVQLETTESGMVAGGLGQRFWPAALPNGKNRLLAHHDRAVRRLLRVHQILEPCVRGVPWKLRGFVRRGGIPPRIHQVLLGKNYVPTTWRAWMRKWGSINPGFDYQRWGDEECERFVEQHDPEFLADWRRIPVALWVVKADYVRILLGVVRGGFYFDCDVEPLHSLAPLCRRGLDCVLFMEGRHGLTNAAFGARPNHPFLVQTLVRIRENIRQQVLAERSLDSGDILGLTGPGQFNVTARDMGLSLDIANQMAASEFQTNAYLRRVRNRILVCPQESFGRPSRENTFAVHWYYNSWVHDVHSL